MRSRRVVVLVVAGVVLVGVGLRLWLQVLPTGAVDSDEAIVGLMARHLIHQHEFPTFFYGQAYGGSLEALLAVPLFAVVGSTVWALKLVPAVLSAVAAVLVWRVGRRTVGERAGVVAALAFWVWPANYLWLSTKTRGFYWACLVLGLAFVLLVLRLVERPERRRDWALLGLVGGLGWWASPQILYFALPGLAWLVFRRPRHTGWLLLAALFAFLGAAPWLLHNARYGWDSLHVTAPEEWDAGYWGNIRVLVTEAVPVALGLRSSEHWFVPVLFPAVYVAALATPALWRARRRAARCGLLVVVVGLFPLVWGALPVSGVVGEGRYVLFLFPFLVLLLVGALAPDLRRQVVLVVGAVALTVVGTLWLRDHAAPYAPDVAMPRRVGPLIDALEAEGLDRAHANYWIAYRVSFESRERVVVNPVDVPRYQPYQHALNAADRPPFLFVRGSRVGARFRRGLDRLEVPYRTVVAGDFVVLRPLLRVHYYDVLRAGKAAGLGSPPHAAGVVQRTRVPAAMKQRA